MGGDPRALNENIFSASSSRPRDELDMFIPAEWFARARDTRFYPKIMENELYIYMYFITIFCEFRFFFLRNRVEDIIRDGRKKGESSSGERLRIFRRDREMLPTH